jgi:hypothetical protein
MLFVAGIEVSASGFEWRLALSDGMDMERALTGRQTFQSQDEQHALGRLCQRHRAHVLAVGGLQSCLGGGRLGRSLAH